MRSTMCEYVCVFIKHKAMNAKIRIMYRSLKVFIKMFKKRKVFLKNIIYLN